MSHSASCARGVAAGFPPAAEMSDADTRRRLAALATTLAGLAEAIGGRAPHDADGLVERATGQQAGLVDLVEASALRPTSLRAVVHELGRLTGTLGDLAQVVSGRAAER